MDVKLIVLDGKNAGQKLPVAGPKFFIGRAEDCHLRPKSTDISRHHAVILVEDGYVAVRDFASKNGTFVNDEPVKREKELKNGDQLRVGSLRFEVELAVEVGGKKKPKVKSIEEAATRTAQGGPSASDDVDIFSLLGEEDSPVDLQAVTDTQTVETSPTGEVETTTEGKEAAELPEEPKEKKKKKGGFVGRYGEDDKPQAENSRSAADEMLKQFMGRRS